MTPAARPPETSRRCASTPARAPARSPPSSRPPRSSSAWEPLQLDRFHVGWNERPTGEGRDVMRVRGSLAGLACTLAVTAGGTGTAGAAPVQPHAMPAEPVVVIMLENKTYESIVGNSSAPYFQSLIAAGTL